MSVGAWAMALALGNAMLIGRGDAPGRRCDAPPNIAVNPIDRQLPAPPTDRWINFTMLQPGRYFADVCRHLGLEHLLDDERFSTAEALMANADEVGRGDRRRDRGSSRTRTGSSTCRRMEGQWAPVQNPLEIADDPQMEPNGYILPSPTPTATSAQLVANPVQFDETPPTLTRAPQFAEHTDDILRELGRTEDEIIQLKIDGAVT